MCYVLKSVSKIYSNKKIHNKVLSDINLEFPNKGMVFICGKSGSGKTTLLNILSKLDKPTSGHVFYKDKNLANLKEKQLTIYRNKEIGFIYQNFNLIESNTCYENIVISSNIIKEKEGVKEKINQLIEEVGLEKSILFKNVKDLSGGEKQRIAIIRALINEPSVILADEPTGNLDSVNSIFVMEILKKVSLNRLVIIVSHNEAIIKKYSDYKIELKDGKVENLDLSTNQNFENTLWHKRKIRPNFKWTYKTGLKKIKTQKTKSVISSLSVIISFLATLLISGFMLGSKASSLQEGKKQMEYGVMSVSHESMGQSNGVMNVVKQRRPTLNEIQTLQDKYNRTIFDYDFSFFLNQGASLIFNDFQTDSLSLKPIYSFEDEYLNKELFIQGGIKNSSDYSEIIINKSCYDLFKSHSDKDVLNQSIIFSTKVKFDAKLEDLSEISGFFELDLEFKIVGVVKDFAFLSTPKIYYSYLSFKELMKNTSINSNIVMDAYQLIEKVSSLDPVSNYRFLSFSKYNEDDLYINSLLNNSDDSLKFSSEPHVRTSSFNDLLDAASIGLTLFLVIGILGTVLIIGILTFSSYSEDKKEIAILYALGANKEQVLDIYVSSNLLIIFISIIFSIMISPLMSYLLNILLEHIMGVPNLISNFIFPFKIDNMITIFLIFIASIVISFLSISIPLLFGSGLNLSKELKND